MEFQFEVTLLKFTLKIKGSVERHNCTNRFKFCQITNLYKKLNLLK